jgi:outer membrane protein assembly factor BamE
MQIMRHIVLLVLILAGCRDVPSLPSVTPYKIDIQQGNVVTQDMVEKLQAGMSRAQVRFILGTPMVMDPFHTDRWDYIYHYNKGGQVTEQRRLIVTFKDDKFVRIEGDKMPPGPDSSAAKGARSVSGPATVAPPASGDKPAGAKPESSTDAAGAETVGKEPQGEEKGFFGRMLERLGF